VQALAERSVTGLPPIAAMTTDAERECYYRLAKEAAGEGTRSSSLARGWGLQPPTSPRAFATAASRPRPTFTTSSRASPATSARSRHSTTSTASIASRLGRVSRHSGTILDHCSNMSSRTRPDRADAVGQGTHFAAGYGCAKACPGNLRGPDNAAERTATRRTDGMAGLLPLPVIRDSGVPLSAAGPSGVRRSRRTGNHAGVPRQVAMEPRGSHAERSVAEPVDT
jgi:hypothetical protein